MFGKRGTGPEGGYVPMLTEEEVETFTRWHERAYQNLRSRGQIRMTVDGIELEIPGEVFGPTPMSDLLGTAVKNEVRESDRVLDMGTGSGINALLAARTASEVVGVDVNPHAVEAAKANAVRNGLEGRTTFLESDVFDEIEGRFDLIIIDPPFRWVAPRDMLERSIADEGYNSARRFMSEARDHLTDDGRILLLFGTSGDLVYMRRLMNETGFAVETIASRNLTVDDVTVTYFTFRLT